MTDTFKTLVCAMMLWATAVPANAYEYSTQDGHTYILEKSAINDIVFMGTTHRQPAILDFIANLLPLLHGAGITHLALEVASDQQARIDRYLNSGMGLADIELHQAIDCPRYRHLFTILRQLAPSQRPELVAIDLPVYQYNRSISRDAHMAATLDAIFKSNSEVKVLAILGTFHVLRQLHWSRRVPNGHRAIRTLLSKQNHELRMFSVAHILSQIDRDCDFSRRLGPVSGSVALDVGNTFDNWRLGLTASLAIKASPARHILDGIIVH